MTIVTPTEIKNPKQFDIDWFPVGREARCEPHPDYPNGVHIDLSNAEQQTCTVPIPYPSPGRGSYVIACKLCKRAVSITADGMADDPCTLKIACKLT